MNCPQCSSEMWDNRENKRNPKGPDYKCKDKACGHPIWLTAKGKAPAKQQANGSHGAKWTWKELQITYRKALLIAAQQVPKVLPNATPTDVVSAAATVFIAASRDGVQPEPQPLAERPKELDGPTEDDIPF
jgi:hypothetical protein